MSAKELEERLAKLGDEKFVTDARRFLLNLYVLFDGQPPANIECCIDEILDILEERTLARRAFL